MISVDVVSVARLVCVCRDSSSVLFPSWTLGNSSAVPTHSGEFSRASGAVAGWLQSVLLNIYLFRGLSRAAQGLEKQRSIQKTSRSGHRQLTPGGPAW